NNREHYIGLKPLFANDAVDMQSKPQFEVIYLDKHTLSKETLSYALIEEETRWHWRSTTDSWEYYKTYHDGGIIQKGKLNTLSDKGLSLSLDTLDWGSYRLEIYDNNKTKTSYRFSSGYEQSSSKSSPDRLPLSIDKQSFKVGDSLTTHIKSKFTGPIMVMVAHHNIVETQTVQALAGEEIEVTFEVKDSWGSSAYILATAFRSQSKKLGANRAIGVVPFMIHHPEKALNLSLIHPKKSASNTAITVKIQSDKEALAKTMFTLSLVDEGILNLTKYQTPDPLEYFLGQQKLGIEIRDIYADLIQARGTHGKFNVGAEIWMKPYRAKLCPISVKS
ncbi:MAG: hypothetical protein Q9M36_12565, partial [Sulfurovum sp.]|nr:hypothetical protein [Sulfurovum sp.]